jgi:hypothetical protein
LLTAVCGAGVGMPSSALVVNFLLLPVMAFWVSLMSSLVSRISFSAFFFAF